VEIDLLTDIVRKIPERQTVLDIGANFGMHALALARAVGPGGKVHAFEPQRIIFNMLAGSVALNALSNLYCYNMAVGDREGSVEIPQFDYAKPLNFGSIEFGPEQREPLDQPRGHRPELLEKVPLTSLDRMGFDDVGLIKIDVEGMEMEVLEGAQQTIAKWRPVLYVEFFKIDREALRQRISGWGYDMHVNAVNYLCIPSELKDRIPISII
jgi:FkbM family methyltransferase